MIHHTENPLGNQRQRKGKTRKFAFLFFATVLQARPIVAADRPPIEQFVRQLESSYKGVQSLKADFTQSYQWGSRTRQESGTVYFGRGGRMRWEYRAPAEKLFIADDKHVLMYIPEEKQLTRTSVKASEDVRVPFRLLLSRLDMHKVFEKIEFADGAMSGQPGSNVLRAIPKHGDDSGIHQVLLEISPEYDIRRLEITYTDRSKMTFDFQGLKRNAPLSAGIFQFTPPPGTQIIDQK